MHIRLLCINQERLTMSDTVDMNALLQGFLDKGGILVTGSNNTIVVGNYFAGSSATTKKTKANGRTATTQEDDFDVNPTQDVEVEADLNRDSIDTTATANDRVKAEEIVRKLEVLDELEDDDGDAMYVTSDILFDAGDQGFDIAEKIIEIGLHHFDGLEITVNNIDAVNAVLKEHYDDKK